jgi:hypothetical protein
MTLLLDFLCRFGWGMAVGLVLTPAGIVPAGFFRVNLLVVLGLATAAALVARGTEPAAASWALAAAAATLVLGPRRVPLTAAIRGAGSRRGRQSQQDR